MGGDFSGKNQDCSKGIYALAGRYSTYFYCICSQYVAVVVSHVWMC